MDEELLIKPFPNAKLFKMSDNMYEALKLASQEIPIPYHMRNSIPDDRIQRVNLVWALIGKELKFKWWTVKPVKGSKLEVWAEPV